MAHVRFQSRSVFDICQMRDTFFTNESFGNLSTVALEPGRNPLEVHKIKKWGAIINVYQPCALNFIVRTLEPCEPWKCTTDATSS